MVLRPEKEEEARAVFEKWDLDFAIVGETIPEDRFVILHGNTVRADLPLSKLSSAAPEYDRPFIDTEPPAPLDPETVPAVDPIDALKALIGSVNYCSREWVYQQYDTMVMADTVRTPGLGAGVIRVHGTGKMLAFTSDVTPRYVAANPEEGGKQAVAEAYRNLTAVGALPLAATDNLNFGNPERPEIMGQFVGAIRGIGAACAALDMPIVSGNVSLYNETNGLAILPTPTIGGVGLIADWGKMTRIGTFGEGDVLILLGGDGTHLGQSVYLRDVLGEAYGPPPAVDLVIEKRNGEFLRSAISNGQIKACHDISDGGLVIAVAEMCLAAGVGADIDIGDGQAHALLFGEDQARYVVAVGADMANWLTINAEGAGVPFRILGKAGGSALTAGSILSISLDEMKQAHESWFPDFMAGEFVESADAA